MGQVLPLPERIPNPKGKTRKALIDSGVTLEESEAEYITYKLPSGWKMVDDSWREDLPNFYIVDDQNLVRFSVYGAWKGNYDNNLRIDVIDEPYQFERKNTEPIERSQTSGAVLVGKMAKAIDSLHRDPVELPPLTNREDYVP